MVVPKLVCESAQTVGPFTVRLGVEAIMTLLIQFSILAAAFLGIPAFTFNPSGSIRLAEQVCFRRAGGLKRTRGEHRG